ncbi:MAG: phosphoribosylamine--glycine ligase [Weeksellaceae bacterium]|nr:phosphoribosylamine--glycine ligase [Weeksellaceae bacterium]
MKNKAKLYAEDVRKVLIIGGGGREHAMGKKIHDQNPSIELFFAPGNAGTAMLGQNIRQRTIGELRQFCLSREIDFTIVGPEQELVQGITDDFLANDLAIFGPHKAAAALEGSKVFAKEFMHKHGVKTAAYHTFRHYVDAKRFLENNHTYPLVIKADGLAAGKGVIIVHDSFEAQNAVKDLMRNEKFGEAGSQIVIEEFLKGYEVSVLSIYNGHEIAPMISAKDHKKIGERETGLNTGGMGVVAPNPLFSEKDMQAFVKDILQPTQQGLLQDNLQFSGIIFFGLMVTSFGIYLLEYNVRMGDPETQAVLPLMQSNFLHQLIAAYNGEALDLQFSQQHSCCVVLASGGYPGSYQTGFEIRGISQVQSQVIMAGVSGSEGHYKTAGGRVLSIVSVADSLATARQKAYEDAAKIRFDYAYYRKDIGVV